MINKSKAYVSPLVLHKISDIPFSLIKNTYIFSDFIPLEPILYVQAVNIPEIFTEDFFERLSKYEEVEDVFDLGEDYLFTIHINSKFNYEYLCFKRGNYSWYTPGAKSLILNYLINNVKTRSLAMVDKVKSVFARDPMLKKYYEHTLDVKLDETAELGSKIEDEQETFISSNYEKFERKEWRK